MTRSRLAAILIVLAAFSAVLAPTSAGAADPVVDTTISVEKTGSEPWDATTWDPAGSTGAGTDQDADNNVVRLQDTITYKIEASLNDSPADNIVSEVLLDTKQAWVSVPTGCQTDVAAYPNLSPVSAIVDSDTRQPGGNARLLICNFGSGIEGTNRVAYPPARVIGASFDGSEITINDDHVSAQVSTYADSTSNTATAGPTDTIVTADFRLNLTKELLVTDIDPVTLEPVYKAPYAAGPSGEAGSLMEYVVRATYQPGSMIADSDEVTFEMDYDLFDYYSDNNTNNDGALSSGAVLYDWNPAKPGCSLAGNHGTNASVTCSAGPIGDFTSSAFGPDGLDDRTIDIDLDQIDVRDPDSDGHLFEVNVLIWFNRATEIETHQSCPPTPCENFVVNSAGVFDAGTGTSIGFNPVSTEDAGGANLANYNGAGEPHPVDTQVPFILTYSGPGSHSTYKSFLGMPWSATPKLNDQSAAAGELIPVMQNVFDYRLIDGAQTQVCDKIDTSVFEFAGFSPAPRNDLSYGFNHGVNNPNAVLFTGSQGTQYYDGSPYSTYLYSTEPHATLAEQRDDTCDDDVDGNGTINIMNAAGIESNPGFAVDWYEDSSMVPGGMPAITKVRWESFYDKTTHQATYVDHAQYAITTNYLFRVKLISSGYGPNNYLPNFMTSRFNNGPGTPWQSWTAEIAASIDPNDAAFSYSYQDADRMTLVPSSHFIGKVTEPTGIKVVKGGDDVDFILTPTINGLWDDLNDNTARVIDVLPAGTTYKFGSERFSADGGTTWLSYADYMAQSPDVGITNLSGTGTAAGTSTLRWYFDSVENGDQLPLIKYTIHVDDILTSGTFTNRARIESPMGIDKDGNGSPDRVDARYQLSIKPQFGIDVLKVVSNPVHEVNTPFTFDLIYKNLGGESYSAGDFIDILPWNGDGVGTTGGIQSPRTPGSDFQGTYEVTNIVGTGSETFFATGAAEANLSNDPCVSTNVPSGYVPVSGDPCFDNYANNGNLLPDGVAAGTGAVTWEPCTSTTAPVTCGSLDPEAITAIRFTTGAIPASGGGQSVTVELTPLGNIGGTPDVDGNGEVTVASTGDIYTNNFGGRVPENSLQIISNDVTVTVVSGSIGDYVWTDLNSDGVQDADELPLAGIDMLLLVEDPANAGTYIPYQVEDPANPGSFIDYVVTTDANGAYLFDNLPSGNFQVQVDTGTLPNGLAQTFDADGSGDDQSNVTLFGPNNPDTTSGLTADDYTDISDDEDQDFGYVGPGSIGDTIWLDDDGDGILNNGEAGLVNVTVVVTYLGADGVPGGGDDTVYTVITDASGNYLIEGLPLGDYTIEVDPTTLPADVAQTFDEDGTLDHASHTTLTASEPVDLDQDFGYQQRPGSIGDTIWLDVDGDGVLNNGETGIVGVSVTVTNLGPDGVLGGGDDTIYTAITGADGTYLIEDLPYGDYIVEVDPTTLPADVVQTFDDDGTLDHSSATALTPTAPSDLDQDFGYQPQGSIGDTIWLDVDGDGIEDPDETGIEGVTVTVTNLGPDGVLGGGDDTVHTAITDVDGTYLIEDLPYGDYIVEVDTTTLPPAVAQTFDDDGTLDHTSATTLDGTNPNDLDQDFGYQPLGSIGDTIWLDVDGDGIEDPDETGIEGVTVTVTNLGPDGVLGGGDDTIYTAITGADGTYLIEGLPIGDYIVEVDTTTLPPGLAPTYDADGANDHSSAVSLTEENPDNPNQDFGYEPLGSIGDTVWTDTDGDGIQDATEVGISGVTVIVTSLGPDGVLGGDDDTVHTTVTDANGNYVVGDLPLGDYVVEISSVTLPSNVVPTFDADGGNDHVSAVTLTTTAANVTDQDFGYREPPLVNSNNASNNPGGALALTGRSTLTVGAIALLLIAAGYAILLARRRMD